MTVRVDLRELERESIRAFLGSCSDLLGGRVLDYGCGVGPYADLVRDAGGEWHGYDRVRLPANVSGENVGEDGPLDEPWDAILCTQVVQYVPYLPLLLSRFAEALKPRGGVLVLTYPCCWPVIESEDLWRFTPAGIGLMLEDAGFVIERNDLRERLELAPADSFPLGGGVVARP